MTTVPSKAGRGGKQALILNSCFCKVFYAQNSAIEPKGLFTVIPYRGMLIKGAI